MIRYLKEQFLIHAAHSAKQVSQEKGHRLKTSMPRNLSTKNALRIARYRNKQKRTPLVQELKTSVKLHQEEKEQLKKQVEDLQGQIKQYEQQYGLEKPQEILPNKKVQLQELISLERELADQRMEATQTYKDKKINKESYEELISYLERNEEMLREKKKKLLLS
ncbi:MAG: hypothetical protein KC535_04205 [Nanoarchaeota archaeon]|nr:hypothetical protein [Nanoarchaeota archaeon]